MQNQIYRILTALTAIAAAAVITTHTAKAQISAHNTHNKTTLLLEKYQQKKQTNPYTTRIHNDTEKQWLFGQNIIREAKSDFITTSQTKTNHTDTLTTLIINSGLVGNTTNQNNTHINPIDDIEFINAIAPDNAITMKPQK